MKTLVIHPEDPTTDFLTAIYENMSEIKLIKGGISRHQLAELIMIHDRVMMLGHGSPFGLLSVGQFYNTNGYIVDHTLAGLLKKKENNLYIWCNADRYVMRFQLKGFYTGMFVSEAHEAKSCKIHKVTQEMIEESNLAFGTIVSKYIYEQKRVMYANIVNDYKTLTGKNRVARYNCERLYAD